MVVKNKRFKPYVKRLIYYTLYSYKNPCLFSPPFPPKKMFALFNRRRALLVVNNTHVLRVFVDVGQSENVDIDNNYITSIFHINKTTPRSLNIPVCLLKKVLRNTVEIATVTREVRNKSVASNRTN